MNIVIGQYIPGNSWYYKLDPRIKLITLFLFMTGLFLITELLFMALTFLFVVAIVISTKISLIKMLKGLKTLLFLLTFTFALQIAYNQSGALLYSQEMALNIYSISIIIFLIFFYLFTKKFIRFSFLYLFFIIFLAFYVQSLFKTGHLYTLKIYQDSLITSLFLLLRIFILVIASSLLTFTTTPTELNNGLESVLKPLQLLRINTANIAMMLSITLRFIPTLLMETNKIMIAQASRGADFKDSKLKEKVNQIISLLIPMFVLSFQRADDLANAMEARGFVIGAKRTKIDEMKISFKDVIVLIVVCLFLTYNLLAIFL